MRHSSSRFRSGRTARIGALPVVALVASAAVIASGMAAASSFTLRIAKNVHVTNDPTKAFRAKPVDKHEAVVVGPNGYAVYTFQGETTHHLICQKTNSAATDCWAFWPPVSPSSGKGISKQTGVKGKLGSFHNHGTLQLTLNGQPLYNFAPDLGSHNKSQATGDELKTFGSIWHIVTPGITRGPTSTEPMMPTTTTSNPYPTTSTPYPTYP
jgi:predicted lipoprotein with Yx(FWY)xxD motif